MSRDRSLIGVLRASCGPTNAFIDTLLTLGPRGQGTLRCMYSARKGRGNRQLVPYSTSTEYPWGP